MALPPRDQRHSYLRFEGLQYTDADIKDFEMTLGMIYSKEVHWVLVSDFESLRAEMAEGLTGRMLLEDRDAQGQSVFTSRAWRRLFEVRGPLLFELIMEFFSTFRDPMLRLCHRIISCSIVGRSQGLTVIVRDLPVIDMAKLARLQICKELVNTYAYVAPGPERQPDDAAGALIDAKRAPDIDEGT
nr:hypothetical protein [Tanacetum cinerariifolium]